MEDKESVDRTVEGSNSTGQRREASPSETQADQKLWDENIRHKTEKKKKTKHSDETETHALGPLVANETRGGAVASGGGLSTATPGGSRAQTAGLSVNDFISKTKNQQRQGLKPSGPELIAYARYLGIDPVADHDLLWIAVEALEAPLPSDWTEHFDSNDRVFYYNATMRVSSWTHPLEHIYRETYKTIVTFRNANLAAAERDKQIKELHKDVRDMEEKVQTEMKQWTEHHDEQGNRFYFNREEKQSTWTDPRPAKCQILYLRMKMLKLLSSNAGVGTAGISSESKVEYGSLRFPHTSPSVGTAEYEDPAVKRPKVGSKAPEGEELPETSAARDSSPPGSSDSESAEHGHSKKKKKKKKKESGRDKKSRKEANNPPDDNRGVAAPPPRLGGNMRNSQSEPTVGGKPMLSSVDDVVRNDRLGGMQASSSIYSVDHASDALSTTGRARPKAGIRLQPLEASALPTTSAGHREPNGDLGTPKGVRSSASVPALQP